MGVAHESSWEGKIDWIFFKDWDQMRLGTGGEVGEELGGVKEGEL